MILIGHSRIGPLLSTVLFLPQKYPFLYSLSEMTQSTWRLGLLEF